ncbi:MAG: hypothetical protein WDN69_26445 [Aliidongia sp.]
MAKRIVDVLEIVQVEDITLTWLPFRFASAIALVMRSVSKTRFGKSVRKSCCARCAIFWAIACAALTSWNTSTAPVSRPFQS